MSKPNLLDPRVYIPSFLKIRAKSGDLVPFRPNKAQMRLLMTIMRQQAKGKPVRIVILKARQMGFSTMTEALCFHKVSTESYKNGLIIAHEEQASQNLYQMFKIFYENLPPELKPMRKRNNAKEIVFENPTTDDHEKMANPGLMSMVKVASAGNTGAGRGSTFHFLHCSEVAFWQDAKTLVTGLFQAVPYTSNSTIILESTANGVGGYFYETWKAAERGENDFIPLFFPWFDEPSYSIPFDTEEELEYFKKEVHYTFKDAKGNTITTEEHDLLEMFPQITYEQLKWRRWCIANNCYGDVEKFHQEYPSYPDEAFIASGRPRFSTQVLKQYRNNTKEPEFVGMLENNGELQIESKGYISIWKHPEPDKFYTIGADVAEGLITGDYSVAYVMDDECNVVARWRGHIDPDLFGLELVKLAKHYNEAYVAVESNNHGLTTLKSIQREDYYNIFFSKTYDKIADSISQKVGWQTNARTKPLMIDKLAEFIRNKYLWIKDTELVNEMLTYVIDDKGSTNAQEGCHDDCVMALAICLQAFLEGRGESYTPEITDDKKPKRTKRGELLVPCDDEDVIDSLEVAD